MRLAIVLAVLAGCLPPPPSPFTPQPRPFVASQPQLQPQPRPQRTIIAPAGATFEANPTPSQRAESTPAPKR
jgi:hypothetical protein